MLVWSQCGKFWCPKFARVRLTISCLLEVVNGEFAEIHSGNLSSPSALLFLKSDKLKFPILYQGRAISIQIPKNNAHSRHTYSGAESNKWSIWNFDKVSPEKSKSRHEMGTAATIKSKIAPIQFEKCSIEDQFLKTRVNTHTHTETVYWGQEFSIYLHARW